ncbi:MAG TPA: response regulator [Acidobacteriaceae bacterium]
MQRRLLFVDDEDVIRITLSTILSKYGFEVTTAATVAEALQKITTQKFDVLLSDLNIGNPGDGLTVVSAMRRTQPQAVTMILTGYPAFETALEAIRQQVDDYIVKPADIPGLVNTIESKLATPAEKRHFPPPKRVAMVLQENEERIAQLWLSLVDGDGALSRLALDKGRHLGYVKGILNEIIRTAQSYTGDGTVRYRGSLVGSDGRRELEGYTPVMLLSEFCLLRRVVAQVVQENLLAVNLSYLVPDLALVNESLDEQAKSALTILSEYLKTS